LSSRQSRQIISTAAVNYVQASHAPSFIIHCGVISSPFPPASPVRESGGVL